MLIRAVRVLVAPLTEKRIKQYISKMRFFIVQIWTVFGRLSEKLTKNPPDFSEGFCSLHFK
jgi:hypothetical protein